MKRSIYLIVVAGGQGTRMGLSVPKQFLDLDGKAVLHRTIEQFLAADPSIKVVTVLPKEHIGTWKNYCMEHGFSLPQIIVEGGITRFHSVSNALEKVPAGAVVAVHDGVRPLLSVGMIRRMLGQMAYVRALVPVVPSVDTLCELEKQADGGLSEPAVPAKVDRSRIFAVQTPQIFLSEDIKAAYSQPYDVSFTDDASVVKRKGIPVSFTQGERLNIKITTQEDLELAKALLPRLVFQMPPQGK